MRLQWVELRDFRNHAHTRIDPIPEGLLVAVGANGEGKTNLLEAMHFLYALESPRASASEPLVRRGAEAGYVRGEFLTDGGKVLVEIEVRARGANKVQVNRSPIRRKRDLRKQIRSIMFGPFDLPVITGDPCAPPIVHGRGGRRAGARLGHVDLDVRARRAAAEPAAERARRPRRPARPGGLGRSARPDGHGRDRGTYRGGDRDHRARVGDLPGHRRATSCWCAMRRTCRPPSDVAEGFRVQLAARRDDELQRRSSLVGPHRDDLELAVRELGARGFASHGETWVAALSLRLGLADAVERRDRRASVADRR